MYCDRQLELHNAPHIHDDTRYYNRFNDLHYSILKININYYSNILKSISPV